MRRRQQQDDTRTHLNQICVPVCVCQCGRESHKVLFNGIFHPLLTVIMLMRSLRVFVCIFYLYWIVRESDTVEHTWRHTHTQYVYIYRHHEQQEICIHFAATQATTSGREHDKKALCRMFCPLGTAACVCCVLYSLVSVSVRACVCAQQLFCVCLCVWLIERLAVIC